MMDNLYSSQILAYAANLTHQGRLDDFDGEGRAFSRLCGSHIHVTLKLKEEYVTDFAQDIRACALGQAAAAMMAEVIIGKRVEDLQKLKKDMHHFLKEKAPSPAPPFDIFALLTPVQDYKNRHDSTLLIFNAVDEAIENAMVAAAKK